MSIRKKLSIIILVLAILTVLTGTAIAAPVSYWYSDSDNIGKWETSPKIWYSKIDPSGSFPMAVALGHAKLEWKDALGTSIAVTTNDTSAPIKFYGGTKAQIDALNLFAPVSTTTLGMTAYTDIRRKGVYTYGSSVKTWYTHHEINGYLVSRTDLSYNNFIKTATHEVGHAMGWRGHSSPANWVMTQGKIETITLSTEEKNHLHQIYVR